MEDDGGTAIARLWTGPAFVADYWGRRRPLFEHPTRTVEQLRVADEFRHRRELRQANAPSDGRYAAMTLDRTGVPRRAHFDRFPVRG